MQLTPQGARLSVPHRCVEIFGKVTFLRSKLAGYFIFNLVFDPLVVTFLIWSLSDFSDSNSRWDATAYPNSMVGDGLPVE